MLIAPLITYPYLVKVLGTELYGWVITAQITATYAIILIDFGFRRVSAKYVAAAKDDKNTLNHIVSTVVILRLMLWAVTFVIYVGVIMLIPTYRNEWLLFIFSYGLTLGAALIPDFYFQGIEQMRYITIINVITRLIFLCLTFVVIKNPEQYIYVPALWAIGYLLGGLYSLYVVFGKHNVKLIKPTLGDYRYHLKETTPIFLSDVMLNVKDKLSYNIMGGMLGMSEVVIYDIGTKIVNLLSKPTSIFCNAIFPSMSRNPNVKATKKIMLTLFLGSIIVVGIVYWFLPRIVNLFIHEEIDIVPLKLYLLVPIFTGISFYIPSAVFVVFGRNKYVLYSTLFSTFSYALILIISWLSGWLTSVMSFIAITVISYFVEVLFRLFLSSIIFREYSHT